MQLCCQFVLVVGLVCFRPLELLPSSSETPICNKRLFWFPVLGPSLPLGRAHFSFVNSTVHESKSVNEVKHSFLCYSQVLYFLLSASS